MIFWDLTVIFVMGMNAMILPDEGHSLFIAL